MEWNEMSDAQKHLRVLELEDGIQMAYNISSFLYRCLENPDKAKHMFPARTRDTIEKLKALYHSKTCFHSSTEVACSSCMSHYDRQKLIELLKEEINL